MKLVYFIAAGTLLFSAVKLQAQINVDYTVNTTTNRNPISAYIYGSNGSLTGSENISSYRSGGNRLTGYNWENNFSNAGSDWNHSNDNYLVASLPAAQQKIPGIVALNMLNNNPNSYILFTLPAAGYVSRDDKGSVLQNETAPSARFRQVTNKKGAAFTLTPDTSDNFVYTDEFLNYVITKKGKANAGGIKAYLIDNEPDLWKDTHPRIFNHAIGAAELVAKSVDLAKTVKDIDNTAEIFGYESYGFSGYFNLQNATDWNTEKGSAYWYIDYYLSKMKAASANDGRRLLDVLSLHWYPEAKGDHRINDASATTANDNVARMQAPRSLWDSTYAENSWIAQYFAADLPLIPRILKSINQNYAGTKLAFTEYNYGDFNHVSSGIAQADVLGIFGKYGVYAAHYWNMQSAINYTAAGFKIFRNYDGANSTFGNTTVFARMSDRVNSSAYASINGINESILTMVVINKNTTQNINGKFTITSGVNYTNADIWGFDANGAEITKRTGLAAITGNQFNYTIPPLSVLFLKLKSTSGIKDKILPTLNFSLYPNPASGHLKIDVTNVHTNALFIQVVDITGRLLVFEKFDTDGTQVKEMNISHLAKGIYQILIGDGNSTSKPQLFIKQ